jgi:AAA15 family ATPase/GTPase
MRLLELSYQDENWELQNLRFDSVNLIVGKNAVGKSRTLNTIDLLNNILKQSSFPNSNSSWKIIFENSKKELIVYQFTTNKNTQSIDYESIIINKELFLERKNNLAKIKSANTASWTTINPPKDKLVLHIRRDIIDYPYLEEIIAWAENSYGFKFGSITPDKKILGEENKHFWTLLTNNLTLPDMLNAINQTTIIEDLNKISYFIEKINVLKREISFEILIKEKNINNLIPYYHLSQGLFRTLYVLVYFEFLITQKQPVTIVIDDLCEGLDYERATKLGELLFEKCLNTNVQLIATSNDSFLMDVVDLKYWNVLQRKGKIVTAINNQNHADLFKKFKFTGLSNFDFFASDFIPQTI